MQSKCSKSKTQELAVKSLLSLRAAPCCPCSPRVLQESVFSCSKCNPIHILSLFILYTLLRIFAFFLRNLFWLQSASPFMLCILGPPTSEVWLWYHDHQWAAFLKPNPGQGAWTKLGTPQCRLGFVFSGVCGWMIPGEDVGSWVSLYFWGNSLTYEIKRRLVCLGP